MSAEAVQAVAAVVQARALSIDDAWAVLAAVRPHIAAEALREAADDIPVDKWCRRGLMSRHHVEGVQAWLRDRADRIEAD